MLAAPVTAIPNRQFGPRPIDLRRDVRPVLELLDVSFRSSLEARGRHPLTERINLTYSPPLSLRLQMARGFVPGFVWMESGQIVGNVSLISSQLARRYLIANMAVHPDFRRRGIARSLMLEAISHITSLGGDNIRLQVERDNIPAISMYESLGFKTVGTVNRWQAPLSRIRLPESADSNALEIRSIGSGEWREAARLDRVAIDPDLHWPVPPSAGRYKSGVLATLNDLLLGRKKEIWVVDAPYGKGSTNRLVGLGAIFSDIGLYHRLSLRVAPEWHGSLEGVLFEKLIRRLKRARKQPVRFDYPSEDRWVNEMVETANFRLDRSLTIMKLDIKHKR